MIYILFVLDILFFICSGYVVLGYSGRFYAENLEAFRNIWFFILFYKIFFNYFFDLYDKSRKTDNLFLFFRAIQSVTASILVIVFTTFYLRNFALPRSFIVLSGFLDVFYIFLSRKIFFENVENLKILLISDDKEKKEFLKKELEFYNKGIKLILISKDYTKAKDIIKNTNIDRVIFSSDIYSDFNFVMRLSWYAYINNVDMLLFPDISSAFISKIDISDINGLPLINVGKIKLSFWNRFIKRFSDIIISFIVCFFLILFLPLIAFIIKFDSEGPVFFVQERTGYKGKIFKLIKFRTMIDKAEKDTGPKLADINDERITKIGKILRKYRIDELPQFFNVLIGSMSIVGPRPEREIFIKKYFLKLPGYYRRTLIKPGITGLAQIYGGYYTSPEEKMKFDFIYMNNYSFFTDIKILFMTIESMIKARGV
ncbi:MAG: sugar transferase [Candidatus Muirbacterium halophilum]|nr:sugar transferase [Candidatus Muirbacterium halophilum]MCK9475265.1 sugar transferase [Candidatus Muirbacterium halophilum]